MLPRHPWTTVGVLALSAVALGGCGTPRDDAPDSIAHVNVAEQGSVEGRLPPDARPDERFAPMLHWAREDMLVLTTFGSSSCPDQVQGLSVREDGIQQVVLADPTATQRQCTADLTSHRLQVPVITGELGELSVWVRYAGEHYGQVTEFSMGEPTAFAEISVQAPPAGG